MQCEYVGEEARLVNTADELCEALECPELPVVEFADGTVQGVMVDLSDLGLDCVFAAFPADPGAVRDMLATAVLDRYR